MNSKLLSTTRRSPIAPYESLVWFALWNIAREQRLNFDALAAYSQPHVRRVPAGHAFSIRSPAVTAGAATIARPAACAGRLPIAPSACLARSCSCSAVAMRLGDEAHVTQSAISHQIKNARRSVVQAACTFKLFTVFTRGAIAMFARTTRRASRGSRSRIAAQRPCPANQLSAAVVAFKFASSSFVAAVDGRCFSQATRTGPMRLVNSSGNVTMIPKILLVNAIPLLASRFLGRVFQERGAHRQRQIIDFR